MADGTHIEWSEATWNPITGCSVLSPGCTNCYAMKLAGTRLQHHESRAGLTVDTKAGPVWTGEVRFNEQWLDQPLRWRRPRMIFVCAHGDLFHERVPDEWIDRVFAVMALCPQHTFQVLTKRSARMRHYLSMRGWALRISDIVNAWPPDRIGQGNEYTADCRLAFGGALPNVWLGVSVEDRQRLIDRVVDLSATPAAIRFWSAEPLLEDLGRINPLWLPDWVICGGESGPGARPMHPDWARSLRDQCAAAGVPFFFKQWGHWAPHPQGKSEGCGSRGAVWHEDHWWLFKRGDRHGDLWDVGKKAAGRLLDGVEHNAMPEARS